MNVTPEVRVAARVRMASPAVAIALLGFVLCAVVTGGVLSLVAHDLRAPLDGVLFVIVAVVGAVGYVIADRQASNPIGWLLLAASGLFALYPVSVLYTVLDYHEHARSLPLGRVSLAVQPCWVLGILCLGLAVALFPDGRLASRRWRVPLFVYIVASVWLFAVWSLSQATLHIGKGFDVDAVGNYVGWQHDFAGRAASAAWLASPVVFFLLVAFVVRQAATWRHATGERRKQLTWLMSGGAVSAVSIFIVVTTNTSRGDRVITDVAAVGLAAIPLAIGVGILKYRLYEIDKLISRTISYLIITGLLVGVFAGIVVLTTDVLPFSSPVAVAASTLAAAGLFNPLRKRVQHLVDRRFNRARYDAETIVAAFALRLRDAVDLDTVRHELLAAVDGAVQPAHASVWIRPPAARSTL